MLHHVDRSRSPFLRASLRNGAAAPAPASPDAAAPAPASAAPVGAGAAGVGAEAAEAPTVGADTDVPATPGYLAVVVATDEVSPGEHADKTGEASDEGEGASWMAGLDGIARANVQSDVSL